MVSYLCPFSINNLCTLSINSSADAEPSAGLALQLFWKSNPIATNDTDVRWIQVGKRAETHFNKEQMSAKRKCTWSRRRKWKVGNDVIPWAAGSSTTSSGISISSLQKSENHFRFRWSHLKNPFSGTGCDVAKSEKSNLLPRNTIMEVQPCNNCSGPKNCFPALLKFQLDTSRLDTRIKSSISNGYHPETQSNLFIFRIFFVYCDLCTYNIWNKYTNKLIYFFHKIVKRKQRWWRHYHGTTRIVIYTVLCGQINNAMNHAHSKMNYTSIVENTEKCK